MRVFETGATRDTDQGKFDYEGFLSPLALERFAAYMNKNRVQADGKLRDSDNWQKGIPRDAYMKSMFRHFMEVWSIHRGHKEGDITEALAAMMFNVQGYLHEELKDARTATDPVPVVRESDSCRFCGHIHCICTPDHVDGFSGKP